MDKQVGNEIKDEKGLHSGFGVVSILIALVAILFWVFFLIQSTTQ